MRGGIRETLISPVLSMSHHVVRGGQEKKKNRDEWILYEREKIGLESKF